MKIIFSYFLIVFPFVMKAQVSAGADEVNSQGQATWNIGTVVTELMENSQGSAEAMLTIEELVTSNNYIHVTSDGIEVYPNPVVEKLKINLSEVTSVQLLDNNGKLIFEGKDQEIDMSSYASGTYFLNIKTSNLEIQSSYKIVKQ